MVGLALGRTASLGNGKCQCIWIVRIGQDRTGLELYGVGMLSNLSKILALACQIPFRVCCTTARICDLGELLYYFPGYQISREWSDDVDRMSLLIMVLLVSLLMITNFKNRRKKNFVWNFGLFRTWFNTIIAKNLYSV